MFVNLLPRVLFRFNIWNFLICTTFTHSEHHQKNTGQILSENNTCYANLCGWKLRAWITKPKIQCFSIHVCHAAPKEQWFDYGVLPQFFFSPGDMLCRYACKFLWWTESKRRNTMRITWERDYLALEIYRLTRQTVVETSQWHRCDQKFHILNFSVKARTLADIRRT